MKTKEKSLAKLFGVLALTCLPTQSISDNDKIVDFNIDFDVAGSPDNIEIIDKPYSDKSNSPFDFSLQDDGLKCFVSDGCQVHRGGMTLRIRKDSLNFQLKF